MTRTTRARRVARSAAWGLVTMGLMGLGPTGIGAPGAARAGTASDPELRELRRELEALRRRDAERDAEIERLERRLEELEAEGAAGDAGARRDAEEAPPAEDVDRRPWEKRPTWRDPRPDLWSTPVGPARLRLIDVSVDVLAAAGSSTASSDEIELLQGGEHDPRNRGFTLQQVEVAFQGAVDPYVRGDVYLVYFLDPEGESRFELEEAFLTTMQLPGFLAGLSDAGFQIEAGTFFTDFGRLNAQHPHYWHWQDQPFVWSRFFGGDGLRGPGAKISWLTPLPWYSDLSFTWQNAVGETFVSFLANDEVFEERAIGGRPFVDDGVRNLGDFVYTARWAHGFDLTPSWSTQVGVSGAVGPNPTGAAANTWIWGADAVVKWRPEESDRGWPFVILQGEYAERLYEAEAAFATLGSGRTVFYPRDILRDRGFYVYALYGFRRPFAAGMRYEWGNGSGQSFDAGGAPIGVKDDPFRGQRHRVSPLLVWNVSEFFRVRLQYSYDRADFLDGDRAHTAWLGVEFGLGAHPAHAY